MRATHDISDHGPGITWPQPFRIDVSPERDVVRVSPSGEVDLATADRIRERVQELATAGFRRVVIDLRGVTFVDSTGLRLLLDLHEASNADGWQLRIVEGSAGVQRAFELSGLATLLPFISDDELRKSR